MRIAQPTRLNPQYAGPDVVRPYEFEQTWETAHDFYVANNSDPSKFEGRLFLVQYNKNFFCMNKGWQEKLENVTTPSLSFWVLGCDGQPYKVHLLKQVVLPEGKKSLVENVLRQSLIKMLQLAPENPAFRAQVLAAVLIPIPDEATTWNKIKDWIESTIDQKKVGRPPVES